MTHCKMQILYLYTNFRFIYTDIQILGQKNQVSNKNKNKNKNKEQATLTLTLNPNERGFLQITKGKKKNLYKFRFIHYTNFRYIQILDNNIIYVSMYMRIICPCTRSSLPFKLQAAFSQKFKSSKSSTSRVVNILNLTSY